jgi:hypothetical protein
MLEARKLGHGRGGVFWQTQGSGKSFSMVFFAQKVLRKLAGNWTFVVVTDRVELDEQIAKTFKTTGAVSEAEGDPATPPAARTCANCCAATTATCSRWCTSSRRRNCSATAPT